MGERREKSAEVVGEAPSADDEREREREMVATLTKRCGVLRSRCPVAAKPRRHTGSGGSGGLASEGRRRRKAASRLFVPQAIEAEGQATSPEPADTVDALGDDTVWQLDFCSRPLLDERGKKKWELLVCNTSRTFEHSEFLPNNKINSVVLRDKLAKIIEEQGGKKPRKVLYFRTQLQTIVTRALEELDIKAVASKRCFSIMTWLDERARPSTRQTLATTRKLPLGLLCRKPFQRTSRMPSGGRCGFSFRWTGHL